MSLPPNALRYLPYIPLLFSPFLFYVQPRGIASPALDPGLGSIPSNSRAREVYSEDWVEGGAYVQLPLGRVRYWLVGPKSGKKITMIHGLSIPALCYAKLVPRLVDAGYQVLLYDLYGRGYSDAPQGIPYDAKLYVTQLALLLQHVKWESTRLVGFSMGGSIVAAFIATFPALVDREVVLISCAGARETPFPRNRWAPVLQLLRRILPTPKPDPSESTLDEIARLQGTNLPGFAHAVASSLQDGPPTRMRWAFQAPAWAGKRVVFIHGTCDEFFPPEHASLLMSLVVAAGGGAKVVYIQDGGHDLVWDNAEEVGRALLPFLDA
ncbi:Alpha/Beta hydrolase protein [Mycena maculata]|uniref:Alpha/Beta hydrolase protein n=1 Tax=Mycena maculata TaxID=230809 RepID=A0AAD7KG74_9AGAR|nr:Alpha/Beta hydrolase protein [Mycena maculata]